MHCHCSPTTTKTCLGRKTTPATTTYTRWMDATPNIGDNLLITIPVHQLGSELVTLLHVARNRCTSTTDGSIIKILDISVIVWIYATTIGATALSSLSSLTSLFKEKQNGHREFFFGLRRSGLPWHCHGGKRLGPPPTHSHMHIQTCTPRRYAAQIIGVAVARVARSSPSALPGC